MVTIRKEPFAWVHAVVDAAVNLIAFDDATAVLLPKARRCVATKLSEQSVVEFSVCEDGIIIGPWAQAK